VNAVDEHYQLERELALDRARKGLLAFTVETKPDFEINWHHRAICRAVNYLQARRTPRELLASWGIKGKRLETLLAHPHPVTKLYAGLTRPEAIDKPLTGLQVMVHPRAGKTEIISRRTPAWWLGLDPDAQIVGSSYGAELSSRNNRDVQRVMDSESYQEIFPKTRLWSSNVRSVARGTWLRNSDIFEVVGARGCYKSAGVSGPLTGMGSNLALLDDLTKNRAEAESAIIRERNWDWYTSTLYTRLEKLASKIIINTRWHEADISGKTLAQAAADPDADQWFCLVFPAILDCEPGPGDPRKAGEALWPNKFNTQRLTSIKASVGSYEWESLYQQRPNPRGGGIVHEDWWNWYGRLPDNLTQWTLSADLSFDDRGDFTVIQCWAASGADRYLVDSMRRRMTFTEQVKALQRMAEKYPQADAKLVEKAANGAALINTLKGIMPGIIAVKPVGSKQLRLDDVSPQIEAGNVYLPKPEVAPWVREFTHEIASFPNGAFDDQVDTMTQALSHMKRRYVAGLTGLPLGIGTHTHIADGF